MAKMTTRRKLAIATWQEPHEPNIYGKLTLDATQALAYIEHLRKESGEKVTITHLVGKAVAMALKQAPTLNGRISFGRYIPHDRVCIAFLVSLEDGADLAKAKIDDLDQKPVVAVASELRELAARLRQGKDPDFEKSKGLIRMLPTWLLRPIVGLTGFLTSALGMDAKPLGLSAFPFGSCIITNVGVFGLDEAFVPPTPFARVPLYVLVGAVMDRPAVVDGKLVVQKQLTLCATVDHRFIDGAQGAILAREVRRIFANPWSLDGLDGPP